MSRYYAAVAIHENGKYYSHVISFTEHDNALSVLNVKDVVSANVYTTRKRAVEVSDFWNECYRKNGTYFFSREAI